MKHVILLMGPLWPVVYLLNINVLRKTVELNMLYKLSKINTV
jgi:hypothetical protein